MVCIEKDCDLGNLYVKKSTKRVEEGEGEEGEDYREQTLQLIELTPGKCIFMSGDVNVAIEPFVGKKNMVHRKTVIVEIPIKK